MQTASRLFLAQEGAAVHHERHRPEQTTLYRLVQQHAQTFSAQTEEATGVSLPQFVKDEFPAFLECGILAHGFLRLRCGDCGHDKLVAFSCKRRGFCPSCGARRMAQTAAHLVEHALALPPGRSPGTNSPLDCLCPGSLPHVPVRQWVLSLPLPIPLRLLLGAQPKLVTPVLQVVHRAITRFLLDQAGLKAEQADSGAVTLIQRFGSAANLNIHLHCLVLDGVYRRTDGSARSMQAARLIGTPWLQGTCAPQIVIVQVAPMTGRPGLAATRLASARDPQSMHVVVAPPRADAASCAPCLSAALLAAVPPSKAPATPQQHTLPAVPSAPGTPEAPATTRQRPAAPQRAPSG